MHEVGLPSFISNTLEDLNIGTYDDIATVRCSAINTIAILYVIYSY